MMRRNKAKTENLNKIRSVLPEISDFKQREKTDRLYFILCHNLYYCSARPLTARYKTHMMRRNKPKTVNLNKIRLVLPEISDFKHREKTTLLYTMSVSYTHLDVYKRQLNTAEQYEIYKQM